MARMRTFPPLSPRRRGPYHSLSSLAISSPSQSLEPKAKELSTSSGQFHPLAFRCTPLLNIYFEAEPNPSPEEVNEIEQQTGLSNKQVKDWFRYHRGRAQSRNKRVPKEVDENDPFNPSRKRVRSSSDEPLAQTEQSTSKKLCLLFGQASRSGSREPLTDVTQSISSRSPSVSTSELASELEDEVVPQPPTETKHVRFRFTSTSPISRPFPTSTSRVYSSALKGARAQARARRPVLRPTSLFGLRKTDTPLLIIPTQESVMVGMCDGWKPVEAKCDDEPGRSNDVSAPQKTRDWSFSIPSQPHRISPSSRARFRLSAPDLPLSSFDFSEPLSSPATSLPQVQTPNQSLANGLSHSEAIAAVKAILCRPDGQSVLSELGFTPSPDSNRENFQGSVAVPAVISNQIADLRLAEGLKRRAGREEDPVLYQTRIKMEGLS